MNFFYLLCLVSANIYAGTNSINPEKTVTPFVDIFNSNSKQLSDGTMEVRTSEHNKRGEISRASGKYKMTQELYQTARAQSSAVFRMIPNSASIEYRGVDSYAGTAFHIGENLVLTNHHVLSPERTNSTECSSFELHSNGGGDVFPCKKVHYCSPDEDICLIEMSPYKRSKKVVVELKTGPALKLKAPPAETEKNWNSIILTAIGNTMGYGIHFSQGRGFHKSGDMIYFYAPVRTGNSGGPLICEDGFACGVVKSESPEKVGPNAYNGAENMAKVISMMREQLVNDPETLKNFNAAVVE